MHAVKKLIIFLMGNMSDHQVLVGRSPVKRKNKAWVSESTGNLPVDNYVQKLTAESSVEPNGCQSGKHRWKCCNHYRFNCTTILRVCHGRHNTQVIEDSGARNCGERRKKVKKNGLPHHIRELATSTEKLVPNITPGDCSMLWC